MVSPKTVLGLCAGVSASIIIGYCIYFDKKRHNDPDFQRKLRERKWLVRCNEGGPPSKCP